MSNCIHGYPEEWRRHCADCNHAEDIAELEAEVELFRIRWERAVGDAESLDASFRNMRKYAGFLRSVIRSGESLADGYDINTFTKEMSAYGNGKETAEADVGPEGAD